MSSRTAGLGVCRRGAGLGRVWQYLFNQGLSGLGEGHQAVQPGLGSER